ncbi:MAG: alpha-galactosidase, partial [Phycisphaerae bacterium]
MCCKITELQEPARGWRYHSGAAVLVERFRDGRLIVAELQSTGIPFLVKHEDEETPAFDLQVDGESLYFGWDLLHRSITSDAATGCPQTTISLKHTWKPLQLDLQTLAAGNGFFRRRMTLTNLSADITLALSAVAPLAGSVFWMGEGVDIGRISQAESGGSLYRVGWMRDNEWGHEGNFQWLDLPPRTEVAVGSSRGRSGHGTPFAVAHNNLFGGYFVVSLGWSANWRMTFYCDQQGSGSRLRYALMPLAPAPMRLLAPGEALTLPEVHFGLNHEGFDQTIQAWHSYQRRHVLPRVGDGRQPFIYNHWGFTEHEMSEESLGREIEIASEIGAELFMVDAGWYADAKNS